MTTPNHDTTEIRPVHLTD